MEHMVIYQSCYKANDTKIEDYQVWIRPQSQFSDVVDIDENGQNITRFSIYK
jgi:hypothetical protein